MSLSLFLYLSVLCIILTVISYRTCWALSWWISPEVLQFLKDKNWKQNYNLANWIFFSSSSSHFTISIQIAETNKMCAEFLYCKWLLCAFNVIFAPYMANMEPSFHLHTYNTPTTTTVNDFHFKHRKSITPRPVIKTKAKI